MNNPPDPYVVTLDFNQAPRWRALLDALCAHYGPQPHELVWTAVKRHMADLATRDVDNDTLWNLWLRARGLGKDNRAGVNPGVKQGANGVL